MARPEFEAGVRSLHLHVKQRGDFNIAAAFAADEARFKRFSLTFDDLLFDFSKTALDGKALTLLENLSQAAGIEAKRAAMFSGQPINETEQRPALHVALRAAPTEDIRAGSLNIVAEVHAVLAKMETFSEGVRQGKICGATDKAFTDIVNIGIGGSDLGPRMVARALRPYHDGPRCHFVSNIDGADIADHLANLNPETTLFILVSKTFTTLETMSNARIARQWIVETLGEAAVANHFVAVSTAHDKVEDFGIDKRHIFGFWNWVGGRLSVWSAVGLAVMIAIGSRAFGDFLAGARAMDGHFLNSPHQANIPVMLGLIGFFHRVICGYPTRAILPYEQRLHHLPAYLQQLDMESNGKQVCLDGHSSTLPTAPIIWGEVGTNAQHAFFQLLHQGTESVPVEFVLFAQGHEQNLGDEHRQLVANCLAQAQALVVGKSAAVAQTELIAQGFSSKQAQIQAPHRAFPGNRPSLLLVQNKLTPFSLGRLLALYEHRMFVEGVLFNINSFDQWGVELGKTLTTEIYPRLKGEASSTRQDDESADLIAYLRPRL